MARLCKQYPDINMRFVFDDIEDEHRINKNAPLYNCKARFIPLSALGFESPLLASWEYNPEAMLVAREEAPEEFAEFMVLGPKSFDIIEQPLSPPQSPYEHIVAQYEHLVAQYEHLPSFMGMGPYGMNVIRR